MSCLIKHVKLSKNNYRQKEYDSRSDLDFIPAKPVSDQKKAMQTLVRYNEKLSMWSSLAIPIFTKRIRLASRRSINKAHER